MLDAVQSLVTKYKVTVGILISLGTAVRLLRPRPVVRKELIA